MDVRFRYDKSKNNFTIKRFQRVMPPFCLVRGVLSILERHHFDTARRDGEPLGFFIDNFIKGVSSQFLRVMEVGPIDDMGSDNFNKRALSQSWIFYYGKKPGFSSFAGSMETRQC